MGAMLGVAVVARRLGLPTKKCWKKLNRWLIRRVAKHCPLWKEVFQAGTGLAAIHDTRIFGPGSQI